MEKRLDEEDFFLIEKTRFKGIITHRDMDGAVAAGLLSRIFQINVVFQKEVSEAKSYIIVETPLIYEGEIRDCLIIDHHMCHELSSLIGNFIICDESYPSVTQLVVDFFDLDIDEDLLRIINNIDEGNIFGDEETEKFYLAYASNYSNFSFNKIVEMVRTKNYDSIFQYLENLYDEEKVREVLANAEQKKLSAVSLGANVKLLTYDYNQDLDYVATRLASIMLQDDGFTVIVIAVKDGFVLYGLIGNKSGQNLKPIFKKLKKMGWRAGGRQNVGGFKLNRLMTVDEFLFLIKNLFK